jgi:hypothetical protein
MATLELDVSETQGPVVRPFAAWAKVVRNNGTITFRMGERAANGMAELCGVSLPALVALLQQSGALIKQQTASDGDCAGFAR